MHREFINMLKAFREGERAKLLLDGLWGLEKESQRVTKAGDLALTAHPTKLGEKTGNPMITTDFSESQLEMITPPLASVEAAYAFLQALQTEVESSLDDELLWPLSMPPQLPEEEAIPLARFNQTKEGRVYEVYRRGLALRYGKKMQMISGLHYNFSFGDSMLDYLHHRFGQQQERRAFIDTLYFRVARNYLRYRWLLIYLFGASPTFDPSYLSEPTAGLNSKIACCGATGNRYRYATSLRVSRFGYANRSQQGYKVSYNSLHEYIRDLQKMLHTKSLEFARLGLAKAGRQLQLNTNVLQKESELYASIRFKQRVNPGETQLEALARRGVGYLEIRVLDLNPLDPLGVSLQQLHFLQAFMLFCLFEPSPEMTTDESRMTDRNHHRVALFGRLPGLKLQHRLGDPIVMNRWAMGLLRRFQPIARLMDEAAGGKGYAAAIEWAIETVWDRTRTPSATILRSMEESHEDHLGFGLRVAAEHQALREFEEEKGYESDGRTRPIGAFDAIIDQGSRAACCCC